MEQENALPTDSTVEITSGSKIGVQSDAVPAIPLKNGVVNTESDTVGMVPISARRDGARTGRAPRSECCLLL
jgi:hypothetical protein